MNNYEIKLFPNPTKNIINISNRETIASIKIMNLYGTVLYSTTNIYSGIDISFLCNGLYLVEINTNNNKRKVFKILKQ